MTKAAHTGELDEQELDEVLEATSPRTGSVQPAELKAVIAARFEAVRRLASIGGDEYQRARVVHRALRPARRTGDPELEESINQACRDLLTILGFELTGGPSPPE